MFLTLLSPKGAGNAAGGLATGTGASNDAHPSIAVNAQAATGTGAAYQPGRGTTPDAGSGTGAAYDATVTASGASGPTLVGSIQTGTSASSPLNFSRTPTAGDTLFVLLSNASGSTNAFTVSDGVNT